MTKTEYKQILGSNFTEEKWKEYQDKCEAATQERDRRSNEIETQERTELGLDDTKEDIFKDDYKKCKICGELKPLSEYYKAQSNSDGLDTRCKKCVIEANTLRTKKEHKVNQSKPKEKRIEETYKPIIEQKISMDIGIKDQAKITHKIVPDIKGVDVITVEHARELCAAAYYDGYKEGQKRVDVIVYESFEELLKEDTA